MKILSIETSCDETAVSIIDASGPIESPSFSVLGNALYSQISLHAEFGGVFPSLAKREHVKKIIPLTIQALTQAGLYTQEPVVITDTQNARIKEILSREQDLISVFLNFIVHTAKPSVDAIAVTYGPGLEPALWVGIGFARALSIAWDIPVVPINHMEGHVVSVLMDKKTVKVTYPVLALLVSGGHTELVYSPKPLEYTVIGKTRDDAVGEAYDKVARMLGIPYPGGPKIAELADSARNEAVVTHWKFPRPMLHTKDYHFSFSGLKTSVLYATQDKKLSEPDKAHIALEFETAIRDVLVTKTKHAIEAYNPRSLVIAGGVISNTYLRNQFETLVGQYEPMKVYFPTQELSTDNAVMIGVAGYLRITKNASLLQMSNAPIVANGNLSL